MWFPDLYNPRLCTPVLVLVRQFNESGAKAQGDFRDFSRYASGLSISTTENSRTSKMQTYHQYLVLYYPLLVLILSISWFVASAKHIRNHE